MPATIETTVLVARMPTSLADAVKKLAESGGRSVEAEVRRALREYVEAHTPNP